MKEFSIGSISDGYRDLFVRTGKIEFFLKYHFLRELNSAINAQAKEDIQEDELGLNI